MPSKVYYNGIEESRLKVYAAVYTAFVQVNPIHTTDKNELHRMAAVAALLKAEGKQRPKNLAKKIGQFQVAAEEYIKKNGEFPHGRDVETAVAGKADGAASQQLPSDRPPEQRESSAAEQDA